MITVGEDKAIRLWQPDGGGSPRMLRGYVGGGYVGAFETAAVDPKGKLLAVAGYDGPRTSPRVRLFDLDTGKIVKVLSHENGGINDLAFSPDGARLAACAGADRRNPAWLWNLADGKATELPGHKLRVNQIAFLSDVQLVTASEDRTARLYSLAAPKASKVVARESAVRAVACAGGRFALGEENGRVTLWDASSPLQPARQLAVQTGAITALALRPDGGLLSGQGERGNDFKVRAWSADGTPGEEMDAHRDTVTSVAASGGRCASVDVRGVLCVWSAGEAGQVRTFRAETLQPETIAWSLGPKGYVLGWGVEPDASRNTAPQVRYRFDLERAAPQADTTGGSWQGAVHALGTRQLLLDPDAPTAVRLRDGGKNIKLSVTEGRPAVTFFGGVRTAAEELPAEEDVVRAFTLAPDGSVYVGSVFSLVGFDPSGKRRTEFLGHTGEVRALSVSPDGKFLASVGRDRTICVWPLENPGQTVRPLLSLAMDEREEWVVWTEPGYFAASPGGASLIGWHVNGTPDSEATFYGAGQFWKLLYRPDVLVRVLASKTVAVALAEANRQRPDLSSGASLDALARFAPPTLTLIGPTAGLVSPTERFSVRYRVSDPNGRKIARLYARVNAGGRGVGIEADAPPGGAELSREVELQTGENVVTLVAENDAGAQSAPVSLRVSYRPPSPPRPNLYLLAIGTGKYHDERLQTLQYPAKDARDFAAAYQKQQGSLFEKVEATVLPEADATRAKVLDALKNLSGRPFRPDDYVIVFLAGHGTALDPKAGNREYAYLPSDTALNARGATALSGKELLGAIQNIGCNVMLVLDTCREGSALLSADDPDLTLRYLAGTIQYGRVTILSCGPRERSFESSEWGNGAFTRAFVQGILGAAPATGGADGQTVTLFDLEGYLMRTVRDLTGQKQNPRVDVPSYVSLRRDQFPVARRLKKP